MTEEIKNKNQLEEARLKDEMEKRNSVDNKRYQESPVPAMPKKLGNIKGKMKEMSKLATPEKTLSLILEIDPLKDWVYFLALTGAILKDLLDLIEGVVILYIVVVVATFCVSIFISLMMVLANALEEQKNAGRRMMKRWLILSGATTGELLIGVDFIPMETIAVFAIYGLALLARKQAKEERKKQRKLSLEYA